MKSIFIVLISVFTVVTSDDVQIPFEYADNDYPITDEMIENAYTINREVRHRTDRKERISGEPTVFFKDKESQQVIIIELYTDYFRLNIYHFYEKEIPDELIKKYSDFVKLTHSDIDVKRKVKDSIENATIIEEKYFTTKLNFRLGMSSKEAVSIYGEPTKEIENSNVTKLIWNINKIIHDKLKANGKRGLKIGETISQELFDRVKWGYKLEITFRNDRAHFIYMENGIP